MLVTVATVGDQAFDADGLWHDDALSITLDARGMMLDGRALGTLAGRLDEALTAMEALESGGIANVDEQRMVGHYWLRAPEIAPTDEIRDAIEDAHKQIEVLASVVRGKTGSRKRFDRAIIVGIGGSALGPQLLADALAEPKAGLALDFIDNTDPDGIDRVLQRAGDRLARSLVVVMSKSGGTIETRNSMLELEAAFARRAIAFAPRAVAVTQAGSQLDRLAEDARWLARLPMWPWVGGRTSLTSAVGLLPLALIGGDMGALLAGAAKMDESTRSRKLQDNPAALLAASWYLAGGGRGSRSMVVIPYRDRLGLLGRYLQQLVMESLGKAVDRKGAPVGHGLTVFGNKGSTDQHAYLQQLLDGPDDFFATFVEVLRDAAPRRPSVAGAGGVCTGDYLCGFLHGTREALASRGRRSLLITLEALDERRLGALIALFERAVGLYAELVDVNAYHQPAVESGKTAAAAMISLMEEVQVHLASMAAAGDGAASGDDAARTPEQIARALGRDPARVFAALRHMAAQSRWSIARRGGAGLAPWQCGYAWIA
jgi:glucose-6-phosphate isomerase